MKTAFPPQLAVLVTARSGGLCEAWLAGVCETRGQHMHHRQLRSRGGKHTVQNVIHLCTACHAWAHSHVKSATGMGLIVSTYADPATTPVIRRGLTTDLLEDGTVHLRQEEP